MTTLKPHPQLANTLIGATKSFGLTITKNTADNSYMGVLTFFGITIWTFTFKF